MAYTPFLGNIGAAFGQKRYQGQLNKLVGDAYLGDPKAMEELMRFNPQAGMKLQQIQQKKADTNKQRSLETETRFKTDIKEFGRKIATFPDFESSRPFAARGIEALAKKYPNEERLRQEGLDIYDEEDYTQAVQFARGTKQQSGPRAYPPINLINKDTGEKKTSIPIVDPNTGLVTLSPIDFGEGFEIVAETPEEKRIADVLAANLKKIQSLEAEQEFKPKTAADIELAKAAVKTSIKAFEQIDKIQANILNLQDALALVREGADTGPIMSKLPSIRSASIALDNMQGRLGLDVVGAVTFGALSKGELDLAMSVALPTGLDGPELIEWIERKIAAQEKLMAYFEEQAIFLSQGNSQADWVKFMQSKKKQSAQERETDAEVIKFDAQGNPL